MNRLTLAQEVTAICSDIGADRCSPGDGIQKAVSLLDREGDPAYAGILANQWAIVYSCYGGQHNQAARDALNVQARMLLAGLAFTSVPR